MPEKIKKLWQFFAVASHSRTLSLLVILLIVAAVPLTVFIAQKQQEIRQRAEPQCREIGGQLLDTGGCGDRAPSETCPSTEWNEEKKTGYKGSEWTWKANDCESPPPTCSDGTCTGGVDNWCYGFECDGPSCQLHCLTLTSIVTPTPNPTNTPAPTTPANTPTPTSGQQPPTPTPNPNPSPTPNPGVPPRPTGVCGLTPPACDPSQVSIEKSLPDPKVGENIVFTVKGTRDCQVSTCIIWSFKIGGVDYSGLDYCSAWTFSGNKETGYTASSTCKAVVSGTAVLTWQWRNEPPNCEICEFGSEIYKKELSFQVSAATPTPPTPVGLPEGKLFTDGDKKSTCKRFQGWAKDTDQTIGIQVDFWLVKDVGKGYNLDLSESVYLGHTLSKSILDGSSFDVLTTDKRTILESAKLVLDNGQPRTVSAYAINYPRIPTPIPNAVWIGDKYLGSCLENPDVDRDGCIGRKDVELWLRAFQKLDNTPYPCPAGYTCGEVNYYPDINNDGKINLLDFSFWVKEMVSGTKLHCPYQSPT